MKSELLRGMREKDRRKPRLGRWRFFKDTYDQLIDGDYRIIRIDGSD
jgi:hypothetical protein